MRALIATSFNRMSITPPQAPTSWHKDFKTSGQIDEPGQRDHLTFSGLAPQIEHGLSKDFRDVEITLWSVDAVIRAIWHATLQLPRGENWPDIPTLRQILRFHYQEKSATDLQKQLSSEVQGGGETPSKLCHSGTGCETKDLIRFTRVRVRIKIKWTCPKNVLDIMLTGLQSDNINHDLQPYLELLNISDELLLEKLWEWKTRQEENVNPTTFSSHPFGTDWW